MATETNGKRPTSGNLKALFASAVWLKKIRKAAGLGDTLGVLPVECGGTGKTSSVETINSLHIPEYVTLRFSQDFSGAMMKKYYGTLPGVLQFEEPSEPYPFEPFWSVDGDGALTLREGLYVVETALQTEITSLGSYLASNGSSYKLDMVSLCSSTYYHNTSNGADEIVEGSNTIERLGDVYMKIGKKGSLVPSSNWSIGNSSLDLRGDLSSTAHTGYYSPWSNGSGNSGWSASGFMAVSTKGTKFSISQTSSTKFGESSEAQVTYSMTVSGALRLKKIA